MTIDLFSIDQVTVGGSIPSPARDQIAELLGHSVQDYDYVRGRVSPGIGALPVDYVLVWNRTVRKFESSRLVSGLQKDFLKEQL